MNKSFPSSPWRKNITMPVILLIVVIIAASAVYFAGREKTTSEQAVKIEKENNNNNNGLPGTFYSYLGTITTVDDLGFTMLAEKNKNYLLQDAEIKVNFDEQTEFYQTTVPETLTAGEEGTESLFERSAADKTKIKVGDVITAISFENVKDKMEFVADIIEIRKVK